MGYQRSRTYRKNRDLAAHSQDGEFFYCQTPFKRQPQNNQVFSNVSADHITPIARGGRIDGLIVAACFRCNTRRGMMPWLEFVALINSEKQQDIAKKRK